MRGNKYLSNKLRHWKDKAKDRRKEIEKYKRRIRELESSRLSWKTKSKRYKKAYDGLLSKTSHKNIGTGKKPKGHSYSSRLIQICLLLRSKGNCSLRSCVKVLLILALYLEIELKCPSPTSIRNWEMKLGYNQIGKDSESDEDWAIIIDESVSVGQQRMLLILGVSLSGYRFEKALSFEHLEILSIGLRKSWKSEDVESVLAALGSRKYKVSYVVSDNGNNLRKALRVSKMIRIEDCTHALGNLIERHYKKHEKFEAFSKRTASFKRQVGLSQYAAFMPPKQRSKGRFLNLTKLSHWAKKILQIAKQYQAKADCKAQFEKIRWILEYEDLIEQMSEHMELLNGLFRILKQEGLSKLTAQKCKQMIAKSKVPLSFKQGVRDYLSRNLSLVKGKEKVICCSDVIESIFGKFKNRLSSNPEIGFTDSCLAIANYGQSIEQLKVKQAMEKVKIIDLKKWRAENLPISLQQRKKRLFKKLG